MAVDRLRQLLNFKSLWERAMPNIRIMSLTNNFFLLTGTSCQGSHLSQYKSYFPGLYRKSKTQNPRILMSCKKTDFK